MIPASSRKAGFPLLLAWLALSCDAPAGNEPPQAPPPAPPPVPVPDPFTAFLTTSTPVADGFGPSRGPDGQVRAVAAGRVVAVTEDGLTLAHTWYENLWKVEARSVLSGLERVDGAVGDEVVRGQVLGRGPRAHLAFVSDGPPEALAESPASLADPEAFIASHRSLFVPQSEPVLALVSQALYSMRLYEHGVLKSSYNVSFGQAPCRKTRRGDNRTPLGMYFVTTKTTGPFEGWAGAFYGGHWIKINYPNGHDAVRGVREGLISQAQGQAITRAWSRRSLTLQDTDLGGGIGLHGWASEWYDDGPRHLSWGCVVLHLKDIAQVYASLPVGTMVVILDEPREGCG